MTRLADLLGAARRCCCRASRGSLAALLLILVSRLRRLLLVRIARLTFFVALPFAGTGLGVFIFARFVALFVAGFGVFVVTRLIALVVAGLRIFITRFVAGARSSRLLQGILGRLPVARVLAVFAHLLQLFACLLASLGIAVFHLLEQIADLFRIFALG